MIKLKRSLLLTAVSFIVEIQYLLCETLLYMRKRIFWEIRIKVIGIRPMAPVLNTGPLEGIRARNVKFFGKGKKLLKMITAW